MDCTIRLYQPDIDLPRNPLRKRYQRNEYFQVRELTPLVRDYFREHPASSSTIDIVRAIATEKQIDYDDLDYTKQQTFYKAVRKVLYTGRGNGWLVEDRRVRRMIWWRLD